MNGIVNGEEVNRPYLHSNHCAHGGKFQCCTTEFLQYRLICWESDKLIPFNCILIDQEIQKDFG